MDAALTVFALTLLGAVLVVAGVYILLGTGWCMIAAGAFSISAAAYLRRGLTNG